MITKILINEIEIALMNRKSLNFFVADFKVKTPRHENRIKKIRIKRRYNLYPLAALPGLPFFSFS